MKRIITFIVTLIGVCGKLALAQETPPPSQYLKAVNAQFYMDNRDSSVWHFKSNTFGWERIGRFRDVATKLNIADTAALLKKTTASSTYAKLTGGNTLTGDQSINGVINVANAVVSNFHTGSFGGLSFAANPNITTSGKNPFYVQSGNGGRISFRGDSLFSNNGVINFGSPFTTADVGGGVLAFIGSGFHNTTTNTSLNLSYGLTAYTDYGLRLRSATDPNQVAMKAGGAFTFSKDGYLPGTLSLIAANYTPSVNKVQRFQDASGDIALTSQIPGGGTGALNNLTNGYGIKTLNYNGNSPTTVSVDTTGLMGIVAKDWLTSKLINYAKLTNGNTFSGKQIIDSLFDSSGNHYIKSAANSEDINIGNHYLAAINGNREANISPLGFYLRSDIGNFRADGVGSNSNRTGELTYNWVLLYKDSFFGQLKYDRIVFADNNGIYGSQNILKSTDALAPGAQNYNLPNKTAGNYTLATTADIPSFSDYLSKSGDAMSGDLLLYSTTPTNPLSAAPKAYIDNLITGITWKNAVRAKTTSNIVLSGIQTIDGISGLAGGRYLVNSQTDATQNGIWLMASGAWSRPTDADSGNELLTSTVAVTGGTINKNTQWTCLNTALPDIGTDAITYGQISGAGTYNSSSGIDLTGNTFTLNQAFVRGLFSASPSTGIVYNSASGVFSLSSIPNNALANGTISGVPLGANLFSLSAGAGLTGTAYNGSAAQTWNINQAFSPVWSALHVHQFNNLGTVSTNAVSLQNTAPAALNAQQFSPALEFASNGWETTGGTSQLTNWRILNTPQQGPTSSSVLTFQNSNNNSGVWATRLQLFPNILSLGGYYLSSRANIGTTSTDAFFAQNTQAATSGVPVQYSPRVNFQGSAWNTSGTISNTINWINEMRPTAGATTGGSVVWAYSNNGGAYTDRMTLDQNGNLSVSNYGGFTGGIGTSATLNGGSNFSAIGGNGIGGASTFSNILPAGSSSLQNRVLMVGNVSTQLAANSSYSTLVVGRSPLTVATTGTHPLLANVIFRSPSISGTGATLPIAANVYIDDAPTGASANYALYVASGATYYGGTLQTNGSIHAVTSSKITNYSTTNSDEIIPTDSSAGNFNLTLLATAQAGTIYTIDNGAATANAVTLIGTINGVVNYTLNAAKYVTIYKTATGTNTWRVIGGN